MFRVDINSNAQGTFWLQFDTQAEVDTYTQWCVDSKHWGNPQWIEYVSATPDLLDDAGNIVQVGVAAHQIIHPAEYTLTVTDISAQVQAEQAQINAIKQAQLNSAQALQALPAQIDQCADLDSLKTLIKSFVVSVATLLEG